MYIVIEGENEKANTEVADIIFKHVTEDLERECVGITEADYINELCDSIDYLLSNNEGDVAGKSDLLLRSAKYGELIRDKVMPAAEAEIVVVQIGGMDALLIDAMIQKVDAKEAAQIIAWGADGVLPDLVLVINDDVTEEILLPDGQVSMRSRRAKILRYLVGMQNHNHELLNMSGKVLEYDVKRLVMERMIKRDELRIEFDRLGREAGEVGEGGVVKINLDPGEDDGQTSQQV